MPEETGPTKPKPERPDYILTAVERSLFQSIQANSNAVIDASNNQAAGALRMLLATHTLGDIAEWTFSEDFSKLTAKEQTNG